MTIGAGEDRMNLWAKGKYRCVVHLKQKRQFTKPKEGDEPAEKRQKTMVWQQSGKCTNDVEYANNSFTESSFRSHDSQSLQQVCDEINRRASVTVARQTFLLYPAFREALVKLLYQIEEIRTSEESPTRIILIHGVPTIGKSALSKCLAYFLALIAEDETVHHVELCHTTQFNNHRLTSLIGDAFIPKYVIFDQINTHLLVPEDIMEHAKQRMTLDQCKIPVILFTSGHYSPTEDWLWWQKRGTLLYKVINMQIDADCVAKMKKMHDVPEGGMPNEDLVNVTSVYGRMKHCLTYLGQCDLNADHNALMQYLYPCPDMSRFARGQDIHFIWLAWPDLVARGLPPFSEFAEDHCKMDPRHVEYLGTLISDVKDSRDKGMIAILNELEITGDASYEKDGYTEFQYDSYCYKFVNQRTLYDVLTEAFKNQSHMSPEQKYEIIVKAYMQLTRKGDSQVNYLRGGLFKLIIDAICEKKASNMPDAVGMYTITERIQFIDVSRRLFVATVQELCAVPEMHTDRNVRQMDFFCHLNVPGRTPFKGYDYAFMQTMRQGDSVVVRLLQLFQVTVNPQGKSNESKLIMSHVLENVKCVLSNNGWIEKCHADRVVTPYIVHPDQGTRSMTIPSRSSDESLNVLILGFPQTYLMISERASWSR